MLPLWEIVTDRHNLSTGGRFRWQLSPSFVQFYRETYNPYFNQEHICIRYPHVLAEQKLRLQHEIQYTSAAGIYL